MANIKEKLLQHLDKLFVSSKIILNSDEFPEFINGGILVSAQTGKVTTIFKNQCEVNSFLYNNEAEVSVKCVFVLYL
jgi:5-keto 4-deoxyuronate isomerase